MGVDWRVLDAAGWLVGLWIPEVGALFSRESLSGGRRLSNTPWTTLQSWPTYFLPWKRGSVLPPASGKEGSSWRLSWDWGWGWESMFMWTPRVSWPFGPGRKSILQMKKLRCKEICELPTVAFCPERLWYHNSLKKWAPLLVLGLAESSLRERNELCDLSHLPL